MVRSIRWAWALLLAAAPAWGEDRQVRGRVVDEAGRPVAGARVDRFWSGNGTGKRPDGTRLDPTKPDELREFWGHHGEMEPRTADAATTGPDGSFAMTVPDMHHAVMAMDAARDRGGVAMLPKADELVVIRLAPLVRVIAKFEGPEPGGRPHWSHGYVQVPEDPTRPLDTCRLAHCGSLESRFEVKLPPGRYTLDAYGQSTAEDDDNDVAVTPNPEFTVSGDAPELDLGVLLLTKRGSTSHQKRVERAKAEGTWGDYTQHYGEPPPRWHVVDAKGVAKDVQPADFRGKWLLVAFWGTGCRPCLTTELPRLVRFDEEHAARRDKYRIVSVFIDVDGELQTIADVDRTMKPIVEHVWGGKPLPFPVLLDPTFHTWERYGLPGLGTVVLIDPNGNLARGDDATLAKILDE